jgi:hypothetical protein
MDYNFINVWCEDTDRVRVIQFKQTRKVYVMQESSGARHSENKTGKLDNYVYVTINITLHRHRVSRCYSNLSAWRSASDECIIISNLALERLNVYRIPFQLLLIICSNL